MKKVGKLTEARMVLPPEPKVYPMVSDRLFEGKVKRKKKLKEVEVPDPRDLASNRPPQPSLSTTNSPARATSKSVQVGGPYDEEATKNEAVGPAVDADAKKHLSPEEIKNIKKKASDWQKSLGPVGGTKTKPTTPTTTPTTTPKPIRKESTTPKPIRKARARSEAGRPIKRGTAKMVANDPGSDMGDRMAAAEKLS